LVRAAARFEHRRVQASAWSIAAATLGRAIGHGRPCAFRRNAKTGKPNGKRLRVLRDRSLSSFPASADHTQPGDESDSRSGIGPKQPEVMS
jgi:hypothetical protein